MLELNKWFFILLLNFFVLLYLLNIILFRPLLKLFTDRENTVSNSLNAAKELGKKRDEAFEQMNRELGDARRKASELFESIRREGVEKQKEVLSAANAEVSGLIDKARAELKSETLRVRQRLHADAEKFSDEIAGKLIGI